jgi:hypothetical protein
VKERREFLAACAVLGLAACGVPGNARLARRVLISPEPEQWQPVLRALAETLVAFDHPRFPRSVSVERVLHALSAHFPVDDADDFASFRRALWLFDDTALFPERLRPFLDGERALGATPEQLEDAVAHDARAFHAAPFTGAFTELTLPERRRYLRLWSNSAFTARRHFYRGGKVLIMISTYSLPELWQAIGYEGPLFRT